MSTRGRVRSPATTKENARWVNQRALILQIMSD